MTIAIEELTPASLDAALADLAELLHASVGDLGRQEAGIVPNYALDINGAPERTIFMFKELPANA